ncbi:HEPN domain-containing protein [Methanolacinia paynteri]|uniref:HEPN domain-containing protein n=1 Tax=Methanolacinia paynteri TaxID=230356 RepID=UPI00064FBD89|nr:HEPN domain-containing protein [Methanolacinia paynteri]
MRPRFERCLETGKIVRIGRDPALVSKEIMEAERDLKSAKDSNGRNDFKWAIIQGYYSQFHSIRALVFSEGYREKSHSCLLYAAEALLLDEGIIDREVVEAFSHAMRVREAADYSSTYGEEAAEDVVRSTVRTFDIAKGLLLKD